MSPTPNTSTLGASVDGSVVFFETEAKLPPKKGDPPIPAAWKEPSTSTPGAKPAGKSCWGEGTSGSSPGQGGVNRSYYLEDSRAITEGGDIY